MKTLKLFRPRFLQPLEAALGLRQGDLCVVSRFSKDGKRELWLLAVDYGGRRFPTPFGGASPSGAPIGYVRTWVAHITQTVKKVETEEVLFRHFKGKMHVAVGMGFLDLSLVGLGVGGTGFEVFVRPRLEAFNAEVEAGRASV